MAQKSKLDVQFAGNPAFAKGKERVEGKGFIANLFAKDPYESDFAHAGHSAFLLVILGVGLYTLWLIASIFLR